MRLFAVERDGVGIVPMPRFMIIDDGSQCSSSHLTQYATLEMTLRAETKK